MTYAMIVPYLPVVGLALAAVIIAVVLNIKLPGPTDQADNDSL